MVAVCLQDTLARLRKAHGLTQETVAGRLGVSNQAVSKWESGVCYPDITLLPDIAALYGVSIDALFGMGQDTEDFPRWREAVRRHFNDWSGHFTKGNQELALKFHLLIETMLHPGNPLHMALQQALREMVEQVPATASFGEKSRRIFEVMPLVQRVLASWGGE